MRKQTKENVELYDVQTIPKEVIAYSLVLHDIRLRLNLSLNEYCVADAIYHLSNNPKNLMQGWCYMSRETLADYLGLQKISIIRIIHRLVEMKLVERPEEKNTSGLVRTTQKWYEEVVTRRIRLNDIYNDKAKLIERDR